VRLAQRERKRGYFVASLVRWIKRDERGKERRGLRRGLRRGEK